MPARTIFEGAGDGFLNREDNLFWNTPQAIGAAALQATPDLVEVPQTEEIEVES